MNAPVAFRAGEEPMMRFHRPSIGPAERRAVDRVLRSGWLTTGPQTLAFEREFGRYVGARQAVGVTSATAAMHLAWASLGLEAGDEVVTSPITFPSTATVPRTAEAHRASAIDSISPGEVSPSTEAGT